MTELINIFIHSHILYFDTSRDNRKGKDHSNKLEVLVTSDWQIERLFYIKLSTYLEICEETHNDFVVHMEWGLKKETDEYMQVLVKSNSSSRKSKKL